MSALPRPLYAVALTRDGAGLAARIAGAFPGARALAPSRRAEGVEGVEGFDGPVAPLLAELWPAAGGFFLVMAAGIAVRSIAPLLRDKRSDPAVVVCDPAGRFAVPLLSGHLGGANELARAAAERLGAVAVITTATDAAGRPAVEVWAREAGLLVDDPGGVVRVNAAWANGEPVGAYVDPALGGAAVRLLAPIEPHLALVTASEEEAGAFGGALVAVTHRSAPDLAGGLLARPRCLALGAGCRRHADPGEVSCGVAAALAKAGFATSAVASVATVDVKAGEPALRRLAEALGVDLVTFPADDLARVAVPTPSSRVAQAVGTPSVAEAAALLASRGGELLLAKVRGASWTLAVALEGRYTPHGTEGVPFP